MGADPTTLDLLELDLDTRLLWLWTQAWAVEEWDEAQVAPLIRLAYFSGYNDALTEAQRGALYRKHGQPVPRRERRDIDS